MTLYITTLGAFAVARDGEPVPDEAWKTAKNKALLKILLTERGRAVDKARLMAWLWPELEPAAAGRNLRVAASQVRRILEPDLPGGGESGYILTAESGYLWNPESDYALDVERFEAACKALEDLPEDALDARIRRGEAARARYRGPYLDEDRDEEWTLTERERLRGRYLDVLDNLADAHARRGRFQRAIKCCRELLEGNPGRERIWRQLMLCHYHAGQRSQALQAYRDCHRALREHLGTDPVHDTFALYESIRRHTLPDLPRAIRHNLSRGAPPLVGRSAELDDVVGRLRGEQERALTLIGPDGVGKSRLALAAATRSLETFSDGVFWLDLAATGTPAGLLDACLDAVGLVPTEGTAEAALFDHLRACHALLILDGARLGEGASAWLARLLQETEHLTLLGTAREPLGVRGERAVALAGLPQPAERGEREPAIQLFVQAARRVVPGFELTSSDAPHVLRINRLVDGLPLGLELAAAWTRVLAPDELAAELERTRDALVQGGRDAPQSRSALGPAFELSRARLAETERRALDGLSAFHGPFERAAAEAVAGAALATLSALVDKALVVRVETNRFVLHPALRRFARARLADDTRADEVVCGHTDYHAALLQRHADALAAGSPHALSRIRDARADVEAAWARAVDSGDEATLARMLEPLYHFHETRGRHERGLETFERAARALEAGKRPSKPVLGALLARQGALLQRLARHDEAEKRLQGSLPLLRASGPEQGFALRCLGDEALRRGHERKAEKFFKKALSLYRKADAPRGLARTLCALARSASARGDTRTARRFLHQSLEAFRAHGNRSGAARALRALGALARDAGEGDEAGGHFRQALAAHRELDDATGGADALRALAQLALERGNLQDAEAHLREALAWATAARAWPAARAAVVSWTDLLHRRGDREGARRWLQHALGGTPLDESTRARAEALLAELAPDLTPETLREAAGSRTEAEFAEALDALLNEAG